MSPTIIPPLLVSDRLIFRAQENHWKPFGNHLETILMNMNHDIRNIFAIDRCSMETQWDSNTPQPFIIVCSCGPIDLTQALSKSNRKPFKLQVRQHPQVVKTTRLPRCLCRTLEDDLSFAIGTSLFRIEVNNFPLILNICDPTRQRFLLRGYIHLLHFFSLFFNVF